MLLSPVFALLFPIFAQQTAPEVSPATPAETPAQTEVTVVVAEPRPICREQGASVGSNVRRRRQVCMTQEEADEEAERTAEQVGEIVEMYDRQSNARRIAEQN